MALLAMWLYVRHHPAGCSQHQTQKRGLSRPLYRLPGSDRHSEPRPLRAPPHTSGRTLREVAPERDTVFVTTKGGYLPLEAPPPASKDEYRDYVKREYLDTGIIDSADLVAGGHCIAPTFLRNQIERSIANLGVKSIDIYYIHTPEQQLEAVSRDEFDIRMHAAFATLEECVRDGLIRSSGCATWNGLRVPIEAPNHLSIEYLVNVARDVAGDIYQILDR